MQVFGPEKWGLGHMMDMAPIPVGEFCSYCGEHVGKTDAGVMMPHAQKGGGFKMLPQHRECFMRVIVGSVLHQRQQCICFGFLLESQPNTTKRQDAKEAVEEHERNRVKREGKK